MNYCETQKLLDVIYKYLPAQSLLVQTETTVRFGQKYKSDFVNVLESDNIGFEVFENEIIIFFFTEHIHFEDYSFDDKPKENYAERAIDFIEKLFALPIEHHYTKKGDKVVRDEIFLLFQKQKKKAAVFACRRP